MSRIVGIAVGLLLMASGLTGCASTPTQPVPQVTVTVTATPVASVEDSPETDDDSEPDWNLDLWRRVDEALSFSDDARKPVLKKFTAIIRHVSHDPDADDSDKALTLTIDKVEANPKFTDGGNEDPYLNRTAKWEKIHTPEVLVLAIEGSSVRGMDLDEFVKYVNNPNPASDGFRTPFDFYYVGQRAVAATEWYLP